MCACLARLLGRRLKALYTYVGSLVYRRRLASLLCLTHHLPSPSPPDYTNILLYMYIYILLHTCIYSIRIHEELVTDEEASREERAREVREY